MNTRCAAPRGLGGKAGLSRQPSYVLQAEAGQLTISPGAGFLLGLSIFMMVSRWKKTPSIEGGTTEASEFHSAVGLPQTQGTAATGVRLH